MAASAEPAPLREPARRAWLAAVAVILSALSLRTAVTSVGALMPQLQRGLPLSSGAAAGLTAAPLVTFALVGAATPALIRRVGLHGTVVACLGAMSVGLLLRACAGGPAVFLLTSILALAGSAIGNVALPTLVKTLFPWAVGRMTAGYTTALAVGQTLAAGLSVPASRPLGQGGWRVGLGMWAVLAAASLLPWLAVRPGAVHPPAGRDSRSAPAVVRSRTAWLIAAYFAAQSAQVFVLFGWLGTFLRDAGVPAGTAGSLLALFSAFVIPLSLLVPVLAARAGSRRVLYLAPSVFCIGGYAGMALAGGSAAWLWVTLVGLGNAAFPLAITLFSIRTRHPGTTAAVSAFAQSVGYLLAGAGPLAVGLLHGLTEGWLAPLALLVLVALVQAAAGWIVGAPRFVEDDLPGPGPRGSEYRALGVE